MISSEDSTIDKSGIIRNVIRLLPKEYQKSTQTEQDLMELEAFEDTHLQQIKDEEGISDEDEADKIDAGCFLWDLSILPEKALFLADLQIIPILLNIITLPQHSSRLHEISLGILANLLSQRAIMEETMEKRGTQLLDMVEAIIMTNTDSMTLRETFRIATVGVYSKLEPWFQLAVTPDIMNQVLVILKNTLNEQLLEAVANFLQWLFYYREATILPYLEIGTASSIVELLDQYTNENSPIKSETALEGLLGVMEVFSTNEDFIKYLKESEEAKQNLARCCRKILSMRESEDEMETLTLIVSNLNEEFPNFVKTIVL